MRRFTWQEVSKYARSRQGTISPHPDDEGHIVHIRGAIVLDGVELEVEQSSESAHEVSKETAWGRHRSGVHTESTDEKEVADALKAIEGRRLGTRQLGETHRPLYEGPFAPVDHKQYIDEGIGATREDNIRSRARGRWDSR